MISEVGTDNKNAHLLAMVVMAGSSGELRPHWEIILFIECSDTWSANNFSSVFLLTCAKPMKITLVWFAAL